ncbi:MAG: diadenylate cyclase CdaA [Bacteroidales bacterium]|jgi:diadenylate cyclase
MGLLFIKFTFIDALDILLVALLLFSIYKLLRGTVAINIIIGVFLIFVIWQVVKMLGMDMLSSLFGAFVSAGLLALIVVFQPEIRKFLLTLGSRGIISKKYFQSFWGKMGNSEKSTQTIDIIVQACNKLSNSLTGALIVICDKNELEEYIETGTKLEAVISTELIESIFFKNNPLHDGAVVIDKDQIIAARCILPVSSSTDIPQELGLRHRSALGITEKTDAISVVVSEQTGFISFFYEGKIFHNIKASGLKSMLTEKMIRN